MNLKFLNEENNKKIILFFGNLSAFLFFSLLLPTKIGHSLAMIFMLLMAFQSFSLKTVGATGQEIKIAMAFLIVLAFFWSHTFDGVFTLSLKGDYLVRYILAAWLVFVFWKNPIHPRAVVYGCAVGGLAAGILAIFQYNDLGRAEGFTNAIRFGNIAMLMGLGCFAAQFVGFFQKKERFFFLVSSLFAFAASILSLSRGGWIMLGTLPLIIFFLFGKNKKYAAYLGLALVPLFLFTASLPPVQDRLLQANTEITGYFQEKNKYVTTSLGARLEQWKVAILMGAEKPLTGWGDAKIEDRKIEYIHAGKAHPSIMNYNHAHNDFIENWARRGMVGVLFLFFIYATPIFCLWLAYQRNKVFLMAQKNLLDLNKFFFLFGFLIYFGYFVFGLSDVFFTFVISHNFYIFSFIFFLSVLQWINVQAQASKNSLR